LGSILISPPVSFLLLLVLLFAFAAYAKRHAAKGSDSPGKEKAYACGEDMVQNQSQPDYSQYFKFAFFFTIMHVVVLEVATDPRGLSPLSIGFLVVVVVSLYMLLRR
jgi:NADH:ubiquinone oxidoreductase subunit 3 (subunit A)